MGFKRRYIVIVAVRPYCYVLFACAACGHVCADFVASDGSFERNISLTSRNTLTLAVETLTSHARSRQYL